MRLGFLFICLFFIVPASVCYGAEMQKDTGTKMNLTSPDFKDNGFMPKKFTCQGDNLSPTLLIESVPEQAERLALIVDDPDAPVDTWVHWVVYNIPALSRIEEAAVPGPQCINDFGKKEYGGPCPPSGTHRYFFKLYALDSELRLEPDAKKADLLGAMRGHILAKAELVGLYKKS